MSASDSVAAGTPGTGAPGAGPSADITPQAGPRTPNGIRDRNASRRKMTGREKSNLRMGLLFISPWIIGVAVFVVYPLVYSFVISLTQYSGMQTPTFIGLQNYIAAFADPLVHTSVGNTVYYMAIGVPWGRKRTYVLTDERGTRDDSRDPGPHDRTDHQPGHRRAANTGGALRPHQ